MKMLRYITQARSEKLTKNPYNISEEKRLNLLEEFRKAYPELKAFHDKLMEERK